MKRTVFAAMAAMMLCIPSFAEETAAGKEENATKEFKKAKNKLEQGRIDLEEGQNEYDENKVKVQEELLKAQKDIKDAEKEIDDIKEGKWYVLDRNANYGFVDYKNSTESIAAISSLVRTESPSLSA